jgi:hypothetical protein
MVLDSAAQLAGQWSNRSKLDPRSYSIHSARLKPYLEAPEAHPKYAISSLVADMCESELV